MVAVIVGAAGVRSLPPGVAVDVAATVVPGGATPPSSVSSQAVDSSPATSRRPKPRYFIFDCLHRARAQVRRTQ